MSTIDTAAVTPDLDPLVPDALEEVAATQETQQNVLDENTQALANLTSDAGFKVIYDEMQKYIDDFRSGKSLNFDTNTPIEVIGQKYLVSSTVASVLQGILDKVTNAQRAAAEANGTQGTL